MTDSIPESSQARIPVAELAVLARCTTRYIYLLAKKSPGMLPLDKYKGVPVDAAVAWLKSRQEKRAKQAARLTEAPLRGDSLRVTSRRARQASIVRSVRELAGIKEGV